MGKGVLGVIVPLHATKMIFLMCMTFAARIVPENTVPRTVKETTAARIVLEIIVPLDVMETTAARIVPEKTVPISASAQAAARIA